MARSNLVLREARSASCIARPVEFCAVEADLAANPADDKDELETDIEDENEFDRLNSKVLAESLAA